MRSFVTDRIRAGRRMAIVFCNEIKEAAMGGELTINPTIIRALDNKSG